MLFQAVIFLLLSSQISWAQGPSKAPAPAVPPSAAATTAPPPLPPPPDVPAAAPGAAALPPAGTEVPPAGPPSDGTVPVEDGSEFATAELETLKPTNRDPFAKPKSLLEKEVETQKPTIDPSVYIDMRIEPIRRFPLRNYILVGIIFDVDNPKAMVKDPDNNMHLLTTNQRIGNQEGLIVKIERGELVVEEKGKIVTIKLHK